MKKNKKAKKLLKQLRALSRYVDELERKVFDPELTAIEKMNRDSEEKKEKVRERANLLLETTESFVDGRNPYFGKGYIHENKKEDDGEDLNNIIDKLLKETDTTTEE